MTAKVRVSGLRGYSSLVRQMGCDPQKLTRHCGILPEVLDDDDALIPYRKLIHLMEHSAGELGQADFGLRLAASQDIGVVGALAVAMQHSANLQEAMHCASNYLFVQSPALSFDVEELADCVRLRLDIRLRNMPHNEMRQAEDLGIGLMHGILKLLAQDHYQLLRVELPHAPLCLERVYRNYFGAPVTFGFKQNAIYVSKATMEAPLMGRNPELHKLAAAYLDAQKPSPDGLFSERVETAVRRALSTDSCDRDSIASAMAIHPRTLQRRLEQERKAFDDIRNHVRRERAQYYLCHTDLSLTQVANLLGYAEQAVLNRSCRRWFGCTPRELRMTFRNADARPSG